MTQDSGRARSWSMLDSMLKNFESVIWSQCDGSGCRLLWEDAVRSVDIGSCIF